jgi:hypothetical protein
MYPEAASLTNENLQNWMKWRYNTTVSFEVIEVK